MHQLMNDNLFHVFLSWIDNIQKKNCFSVITVNLEITRLWPGWIFDKF